MARFSLLLLLATTSASLASSAVGKEGENSVLAEYTCSDLRKAVEVIGELNATIRELETNLVEKVEGLLRERLGDKPTYATIKCKPVNARHANKSTQAYMSQKDEVGNGPLHHAAKHGNLDEVRWLVESGDDINKGSNVNDTPLIWASYQGHLAVVRWLVENGADVHLAKDDGWTALHFASGRGHFEVARLLIDCGANVNRAANDESTPLHLACAGEHLDLAELLLSNAAGAHRKNSAGKSPYDLVEHITEFQKLFARF